MDVASHRRFRSSLLAVVCVLLAVVAPRPMAAAGGQIGIRQIDAMPNLPQPFKIRDWRKTACDYDALVFDLEGHEGRPPLVWIDKTHRNFTEDAFGVSYTSAWEVAAGPIATEENSTRLINTIPRCSRYAGRH